MTIVTALATLVFFDALLAGFRAAAGRNGRIAKSDYYRRAVARGAAAALLIVGGHAGARRGARRVQLRTRQAPGGISCKPAGTAS